MNVIEIKKIAEVVKILEDHLNRCKSEEIEKAKDILDDLIEFKIIDEQRWLNE